MKKTHILLSVIIILMGSHCLANEGVPLRLPATIISNFYYAPETGFRTSNYLRIFTNINTGSKVSLSFYLYGIFESSGGGFELSDERWINPWIDYLRINLAGPILPSGTPISVTMGQGLIMYSPYIASLNIDFAKQGQGIMFKDLSWGKVDFSGFLIWEKAKPYRDIGDGFRAKFSSGPWKFDAISVRHLNGDPIIKDGKVESLGVYQLMERDLQVQIEHELPNGAKINYLLIEQKQPYSLNPLATAKKLDINLPMQRDNWLFSYRNFDYGFAPRYRDRTPLYLLSSGVLSAWNPVDRYKNQQGISMKVNGSMFGKRAHFSLDHYALNPDYKEPRINFECGLDGNVAIDLIGTYDYTEQSFKYFESQFKQNVLRNSRMNVYGELKYIYDRVGNNNDLKLKGSRIDYGVEVTFRRGFFAGLTLGAGIKQARNNYRYFNGRWFLLNNIGLEFSYQYPWSMDSKDYWIDDFNRIHYRDNYLSLKSNVNF